MTDTRVVMRALAALAVLSLAGPAVAARQEDPREREGLRRRRPASTTPLLSPNERRPPAPAIPGDLEWLQGGPLTAADLKGKVILLEFWEFTCINCLRVLPIVESLRSIYGPAGLVVIGIHAPDFTFSRDAALVSSAVKRLGIGYAVVNDPQMEAWRAFENNGWPSALLIDARGRLAWRGVGEDEYGRLEERIRALLQEAGAGSLPSPSHLSVPDPFAPGCGDATPEVFVGHARGTLANPEGYAPGATRAYAPSQDSPPEGQPLLAGAWIAHADGISKGAGGPSTLTLVYQAKEVYGVLHRLSSGSHTLEVRQDGSPLGPALKGADVVIDAQGRSLVTVDESRLYVLVTNPKAGTHSLELSPQDGQSQIASFTFGGDCQPSPSRR